MNNLIFGRLIFASVSNNLVYIVGTPINKVEFCNSLRTSMVLNFLCKEIEYPDNQEPQRPTPKP